MPTYVDSLVEYKSGYWCHLLADDLDELHAMADKLGLKRSYYQPLSTPHYDLRPSKRLLALKYGAKQVTGKQVYELIMKWRSNHNDALHRDEAR